MWVNSLRCFLLLQIRKELETIQKQLEGLLIQTQASSILDSSQDLANDMAKLSITADKRVSVNSSHIHHTACLA